MKPLKWFGVKTEEFDWQPDSSVPIASKRSRILKSTALLFIMLATATLVSIGFRNLGYGDSNYIMTYNLCVVLIAYFTDGFTYCVIASILSMLLFNFFFTVPYYTFLAYSPDYPVTFISMLISALIASALTSSVKRESRRAENRERSVRILYQYEKNLLAVNSKPQLLKVAAKDISEVFGASVMIAAADLQGQLSMRHVVGGDMFRDEVDTNAISETFQSGMPCGAGSELYRDSKAYYLPITGANGVLGVIGIAMPSRNPFTESQALFLDAIAGQIALAMERERLFEKQQRVKLEIEREHLRGDLLRSVSHDLRTPLTGMLGSVGTLIDNYDVLNDITRKELLSDVYSEVEWLSALVENVLSLTRLDSQHVQLQKQPEAVEEIVAEALSRVKRRIADHPLTVSTPDELLIVPMDGTLIVQVLVNMLDNAIQHTPDHSSIQVRVHQENAQAVFEVADHGPGLSADALASVFERFYSKQVAAESRKGAGLGLSICKSIIKAHGGTISAENAAEGGAVFRFTLPLEG
jgi:two-component system, OmpR family, sensor histidine kinase KdpD